MPNLDTWTPPPPEKRKPAGKCRVFFFAVPDRVCPAATLTSVIAMRYHLDTPFVQVCPGG